MADAQEIDDETLEDLYSWIDKIPLTRPKKDIKRDFADAVLVAEIVHAFAPHLVEMHNYVPAHKYDGKVTNWKLLNRKVFKKLGFQIADDVINNICGLKPMAVELFFLLLRRKIDRYLFEKNRERGAGDVSDRPESDQVNVSNVQQKDVIPGRLRPLKKTNSSRSLPVMNSNIPTQPRNTFVQNDNFPIQLGLKSKQETVSKIVIEEKEQEILAKEETIQILQAKVRRLEHLLHLKDVRVDDLQARLDRLEVNIRPSAQHPMKR